MARHRGSWALVCLAGLSPLPGCGGGGQCEVAGTITFEGKPLEDGFISFLPDTGDGPTSAVKVSNGRYKMDGLTPGKTRVMIVSAVQAPAGATASAAPATKQEIRNFKPRIPSNAVGNNTIKEIAPGSQTLDFRLENPK